MGVLALTRPVAGAPVLASDIDTMADELEAWSNTIDAGNIAQVSAHAAQHAPAQSDTLDGSYIGISAAGAVASGLTLRCGAHLVSQGGALDLLAAGPNSFSVGAVPADATWTAAGVYLFTFAGYDVADDHMVFAVTQGVVLNDSAVQVIKGAAGFALTVQNGADLLAGTAVDIFVFEVN